MADVKGKQTILVVGPGRSGTSAITRALTVLGVELGENLMPPKVGVNDKGFWEDQDIYSLNLEIFKELEHDWHNLTPVPLGSMDEAGLADLKLRAAEILRCKLRGASVFGMKDPQMTRLLPFWREIFGRLEIKEGYVIACRNPMSVARSLSKYAGVSLDKAYLLWFEYTLTSLTDTIGGKRVVVDFDLLMENPEKQLYRIASSLDLNFEKNSNEFKNYHNEFLAADLRHTEYKVSDLRADQDVPPKVVELYSFMLELAADRVGVDDLLAKKKIDKFLAIQDGERFLLKYLQNSESLIAARQKAIVERDALVEELGQTVESLIVDRDSQKAGVEQLKEAYIQLLKKNDEQVAKLNEDAIQRDALIGSLGQSVDSLVITCNAQKAVLEQPKAIFAQLSQERDGHSAQFNQVIAERDVLIDSLRKKIESLVMARTSQEAGLEKLKNDLVKVLREHDDQVVELKNLVAARDEQIGEIRGELLDLYNSKSWRVTSPLRKLVWWSAKFITFLSRGGRPVSQVPISVGESLSGTSCESVNDIKINVSEKVFRILLVSHYCPTRAHAGGLRILDIYSLIREQCSNIQIDLLTHHRPTIDWSLDDVYRLFDNVYLSPAEDLSPTALAEQSGFMLVYDVIDLQFHQTGHYVDDFRRFGKKIIFTPMESAAKVLFLGVRSHLNISNFLPLRRLAAMLRTAAEELVFTQKVDEVVCVSSADAIFLRAVTSSRHISGVDTGVSQFEFKEALDPNYEIKSSATKRASLLYIAYFGSETNVLALHWYLEHVHPMVKAFVPGYVLTVVGRGDLSPFQKYQDQSIEFVGEVETLAPYIEKARVGIAPALGGSGFRGKVNQYAVVGCPCVVSPIAFKGLSYQDGVNIFVAETPETFADRCIQLLTNLELNDRMGAAARKLCMERYSWQSKWASIRKIYKLEEAE